jgi:hypothetical protein
MNALEQKILELLPLLSEDVKFKARLILGENPSFTKKKKTSNHLTKQEAVVLVRKF